MTEYESCSNCSEEVTTDSDFCPHCGALFRNAGEVFCENHPDNEASGVCIICRKLVCHDCSVESGHRMFCSDHNGIEVRQDWAGVFQSTDINEAELVKSFLLSEKFTVQVQNFNSIGFVWDGGGDSSISRSALSKPAKVFVPIPEYIAAAEAVRQWNDSAAGETGGSESSPQ